MLFRDFSFLSALHFIPLFLVLWLFFHHWLGQLPRNIAVEIVRMIRAGIYSFNSVLSGMAVILFLTGDNRWIIALLAAAIAALSMVMLTKWIAKWGIPILTLPFVFITWIGLLVTYRTDVLHMDPGFVTSSPARWNLPTEGTPTLLVGLIKGIGEVFIIDSLLTGSLILVGLFLAGWRFGVYAIIGTFVSWLDCLFYWCRCAIFKFRFV